MPDFRSKISALISVLCLLPFASLPAATPDPGPGDDSLRSPRYAVTINGQPSFVYHNAKRPEGSGPLKEVLLETMAWTTVASDTPVEVEVTFLTHPDLTDHTDRTAPLRATLRPLFLNLTPRIDGNRVRFTLPPGRKVTLEETDRATNPLFIFGHPADAPLPTADANTLVFPAGVHRLSPDPFLIRSGQTIVLAPGAYVEGRLHGHNLENVRLLGRGTISGTYLTRPPMDQVGGYEEKENLLLAHLRGAAMQIHGPTFVDAPFWTARFAGTDPARPNHISHVAILGWYMNTDGFQEMHHTRAADLFTCVNDDAFILNNTGDCTVERAVVWGLRAGAPIRLGWNGVNDLSRVIYRDIDIVHFNGHSAISLWHGGPAHVRDILIENIRLEGPMDRLLSLLVAKNPWSPPGHGLGRASDLTLRNITAEGPFAKPSEITGTEGHPIENILIENLRIGGRLIRTLDEIPVTTNEHARAITITAP